ncbi:MAG: hypothetical protein M3Y48_16305 [Actinomycetota bacterium]|nr:hypothetical protein [Actinomycetota bacterium]
MTGVPDGEAVVLDVAALEALLVTTFNIGLDVGCGKDKAALVGCGCPRRWRPSRSPSNAACQPGRSPRRKGWRCTLVRLTASLIRSCI